MRRNVLSMRFTLSGKNARRSSNKEIFSYLKHNAAAKTVIVSGSKQVLWRGAGKAGHRLDATYNCLIAHAPLEPLAAVALVGRWELTV